MSFSLTLPKGAWLTVGLLWGVGLLNYLDRIMLTTMRGSLTEAIPMTDAQFGLLTSAFLWVYAALSPFAGFLADRHSRSRVIIISLLSWSVVTWLTAHATTYGELLATRALMGITEACYIPAAMALIADYHRGDTRSKAEGLHISGIIIGSGLGGLGGLIAEQYDWTLAFTLFGYLGIAYTLVLLFLLRDAPRELPQGAVTMSLPGIKLTQALSHLLGQRTFNLALLYWGLLALASWSIVGWMPTYLNEHFQLSQGVAGMSATGYLQTAMLGGVMVGGIWSDHWYRTNERSRIYVPFIGLCLAVPAIVLAVNASLLPVALIGLMGYGFTRAFVDSNMMPILCMVADPRYRATGFGLLNLCAALVGGLTIYAGGALRDAHVDIANVFMFGAAGLLVCAGILLAIKPQPSGPTIGT